MSEQTCPDCEGTGLVGTGKYVRPGPWFQARALGLWPDSGSGVWNDALWEACQLGGGRDEAGRWLDFRDLPQLGLDCATGKGDDYHGLCGRWACLCLFLESANTMDPAAVSRRVKVGCERLAAFYNGCLSPSAEKITARQIPIKIDDDGVGCAVSSFLSSEGYSAHPVGAGTKAVRDDLYPLRRDELWFQTAERAKSGRLKILPAGVLPGFGLDREARRRLKQQLMAPEWWLVGKRRQVEPKEDTKKKIGRSPDEADAFNLSLYEAPSMVPTLVEVDEPPRRDRGFLGGRRG